MTGDINTLAGLVDATAPLVPAVSMGPVMCLSDSSGYFSLATGWTGSPLASTVPLDGLQQQLDQLIDKMAPLPPADALSDQQVVQLFIQSIYGDTGELSSALDELAKLSREDRFAVLEELSSQAPTLDAKTYLELIEDQVAQLPDANATLQAAMLVVLMNQGGRTLGSIDMAVNFMQTIVTLPENDQWQLLTKLGLKDSDIEGTMAAITGEAIAAGILTPPTLLLGIFTSNQETTQIGEWNPPGKMAGWFYIGNAVHAAIAPEYLEANLAGHIIFTNTTPVDRILAQLQGQLMFKGSRVATALGLALAAHPDSFFTIPHFDGYPAVLIWGGAGRGDHRRLAGVRAAPARPGFPRRLASSQSCHPIGRHDSVALDREC